jgi:protein-tyrosine-phosphatase
MISTSYHVLFLCTGNSASSFPRGEIHPAALNLLRGLDYPIDHLRSKSWDEFAGPSALQIDFIFTLCENAADEPCPFWPGKPTTVRWGLPDPAAVDGSDDDIPQTFSFTYHLLSNQISTFIQLAIDSFDKAELLSQLVVIDTSIARSTQDAV